MIYFRLAGIQIIFNQAVQILNMSQTKITKDQVKSPEQKISQIKQEKRKEQIEGKFSSIRKNIIKVRNQEEFSQQKEKQTNFINQQIKAIMSTQTSTTFQLVSSLWSHCATYNFRYLSEDNVKDLLIHIKRLIKNDLSNVDTQNEIMMVVWLISNWTSEEVRFKMEFTSLIDLFVRLLEKDLSSKLNHLLIYTLVNLCKFNLSRIQMMEMDIIGKIMVCHIYQKKEADISTLLTNLIYRLPQNFNINNSQLNTVIYFLSINLQKSKTDELMKQDSILLIERLLSINGNSYHSQVILKLTPNILFYINCLQNAKNLSICFEIFNLLTSVYAKIDYSPQTSYLFSEETFLSILKLSQQFLEQEYQSVDQKIESKLKRQIWILKTNLLKIQNSDSISSALDDLFKKCTNNQIEEYEEYAITILAQNYQGDEGINFCISKLQENISNEDLRLILLSGIERRLKKCRHPENILRSNTQLIQVLQRLQLDYGEQLRGIIKRLFQLDPNYEDQSNQILISEQSSGTVTGSFNQISSVLTSPQVKASSHGKQKSGSKIKAFMEAEEVQ